MSESRSPAKAEASTLGPTQIDESTTLPRWGCGDGGQTGSPGTGKRNECVSTTIFPNANKVQRNAFRRIRRRRSGSRTHRSSCAPRRGSLSAPAAWIWRRAEEIGCRRQSVASRSCMPAASTCGSQPAHREHAGMRKALLLIHMAGAAVAARARTAIAAGTPPRPSTAMPSRAGWKGGALSPCSLWSG